MIREHFAIQDSNQYISMPESDLPLKRTYTRVQNTTQSRKALSLLLLLLLLLK